jgi:hypothetical protein
VTAEQVRALAGSLKVKFFFANEYTTCTACGGEIWFDDTVCIDQAGTGLRHEECPDDHH